MDFGRGEVQRIASAEIQGEPVRNLPFVARKELRDMGALLEGLILNVDAESVHLAQQERSQSIAAGARGRIRAGRGEGVGAGRVRRIDDVESFAPEIGSELEGVPSANHREGIQKLRDRRGEVGVGGGGRPDLLITGDGKDGERGGERAHWRAGDGDAAILERCLVHVPARVPEARLVQR